MWASDIKEALEHQVATFAAIKHPALMERFVLRNGKAGISRPRPENIAKRPDKECFSNSADWILSSKGKGWAYVEGYAVRTSLGMLVHHAWVEDHQGHVLDLTWREPEHCQYFGVRFDEHELRAELMANEVYGLLVPFDMYNEDLMFRKDPGLRPVFDQIVRMRQAAAG